VDQDRSTLLTSPLSMADFAFRVVFFALAPFAIVVAAELFPMQGVLLDIGLALGVFVVSEGARRWSERSRVLSWFLSRALDFELYYRSRPPRRFAYYLFYPLFLPYWLLNREARREFWMFRGYTAGGFVILCGVLVWQYFHYWAPQLGWRVFLPSVALTLSVETLIVLMVLMPFATTVVWYHSSFRRKRLVALLVIGLVSTVATFGYIAHRRSPIVSYATRERVRLRTAIAPRPARRAILSAAREAWSATATGSPVQGDGKVEGLPLDRARAALEKFYKPDEAAAFQLWATPRTRPRILVVYFEARRGKLPIWLAIRADKSPIRSPAELPRGAFRAMRRAVGGNDPIANALPENLEITLGAE
jgi:hypothetical protein